MTPGAGGGVSTASEGASVAELELDDAVDELPPEEDVPCTKATALSSSVLPVSLPEAWPADGFSSLTGSGELMHEAKTAVQATKTTKFFIIMKSLPTIQNVTISRWYTKSTSYNVTLHLVKIK
jgi:hypothetical protein